MNREANSIKLSLGLHMGYAVGTLGESVAYNAFYFFFIYFLTNVAGINPIAAGLISLVAVLWDAVTDPAVGYISDNILSKYGRRRPLMLIFFIPLGIFLVLLFTNVSLPPIAKVVYFIFINILFWIVFTATDIPYIVLGSELTNDFNERTKLRVFSTVFAAIGLVIASMMINIVDKISDLLGNVYAGWSCTALLLAVVTGVSYFAAWISTRGKELKIFQREEKKGSSFSDIIRGLVKTTSIRSFRILLIITLLFCIGLSLTQALMVYSFKYNLGLEEAGISYVMLAFTLILVVSIVMVGLISSKIGKGKTIVLGLSASTIAGIIYIFIPLNIFTVFILIVTAAFSNGAFWTLVFSMGYDICEVSELKIGKRQEGAIISILSLLNKVGFAIGMFLTGFILDLFGFDAEAVNQTANTLWGIKISFTIVPAIFYFFTLFVALRYPLTQEKFRILKNAIEFKKAGKEYPEDELRDL